MYLKIIIILLTSFTAYANLHLAFIVIPAYLIESGFSEMFAAVQNTVFAGAAVVLRFLLTPLVGRRRKLSLLLSGAALGLAPVALLWGGSLLVVTFSRIVQGFGLALYSFSANTFLADVSPAAHRGAVLGVMRLVIVAALMSGPPFAVWGVEVFGYHTLFVFLALVGLIGLAPLLLIREPRHKKPREKQWTLFGRLLRDARVLPLFYIALTVGVVYGCLLTFVPMLGLESDLENYGVFFTVFAAAGAFVGIFAGRLSDLHGRAKIIKPAVTLFGLGTLATGLLGTWPFLWVGAALTGVGYAAVVTIVVAWIIDRTAERLRASALSLYENALDLGITGGVFAFGMLTAVMGIGRTFMVTGAAVVILGLMTAARAARPRGKITASRDQE